MTYYPKVLEFLNLAAIAVTLCLINFYIRERWTRQQNAIPVPLAALMWIAACGVCLFVSTAYYQTVPDMRKLPVLMWCLLFLMVPVFYYSYSVIDSLAIRSIDRIGPFSARIEDPSEFSQARRMALRGDIDGAVQRYRQYRENEAAALFEAARLLKSVDRFVEAALLLEEIATRFKSDRDTWAEAIYLLAKTNEISLNDHAAAMALLRQIIQQAPATRYGRLAATDVSRLEMLADATGSADSTEEPSPAVADEEPGPSEDPFYRRRAATEPSAESQPPSA